MVPYFGNVLTLTLLNANTLNNKHPCQKLQLYLFKELVQLDSKELASRYLDIKPMLLSEEYMLIA
jgi:hypothetical protein